MYVKEYSPDLIHSRRLGWFKVARRMINHEPEKVKVLMIGIIVLETYVCALTRMSSSTSACVITSPKLKKITNRLNIRSQKSRVT